MVCKVGSQKDFIDEWKKDRDVYFAVQHKLLSHVIDGIIGAEKIEKKEPDKKEAKKPECPAEPVKSVEKKPPSPLKT